MSYEYETESLNLAAYIHYKGVSPESVRNENGVMIFIYKRTPKLEKMAKDFYKNVSVRCVDYSNSIALVKTIFN